MPSPTPPPLDFDHQPGLEIATKHKEAIRQLHGFAEKSVEELMAGIGWANQQSTAF
jgi:hypothetical protein